jgi:hypothetical protein
MAEFILNKQALKNADDLKVASSTAVYPLGFVVETIDENNEMRAYMYVKSGVTVTAKDVSVIDPNFKTSAPATSAYAVLGSVANIDVTSGEFYFAQIKGKTTVVSAGATTAGHFGKMTNSAETITDASAKAAATMCEILTTKGSAGDVEVRLSGFTSEI